mmetsp:Transcript_17584/g.31743  ORF Transcript_17584/g.31743 Transcript_17584/m.31743 type:complete len:548 (+) Transcript_17584:83-1726(+)
MQYASRGTAATAMLRLSQIVLWAALTWEARADLPVHCLRHQIVGEWDFKLGPLGPKRSSCGHRRPDDQNEQPSEDYVASLGETSGQRIRLEDPSTSVGEDGATGTWTMIYDEGFEVALRDQVFFAFSGFDFVTAEDGARRNVSQCDRTQVGWYHDKLRDSWGCYVARKTTATSAPRAAAKPITEMISSRVSAAKRIAVAAASELLPEDVTIEPPVYKPWVPDSAGYDAPMHKEWQKSLASALNFLQLGWEAQAYTMFSGKTPRELNRLAGVRRNSGARPPRSKPSSFSSFLGIGSRVVRRSGGFDSFDWRQKDGKNWLTPVVTQGDCGSCYTISTVHMLTARHRIQKGDPEATSFSVSFPLYCSEYNQGCDGGYGFLQSKWSEDVGLVPESCAPFSQGGGRCEISAECDLGATRYRAFNHHYVGGFYGGSDEEQISRELVTNGPLVVSFEPKEDFMYYRSGIYRSAPSKIHQEWEQVDHAVLLIGYGQDAGNAYWTMQNSWGDDWGEGGYFRMARGTDESGCESIAVAAETLEEDTNHVLDDFLSSL